RSVVLDLVCFRRHGHQEQDTPNITQPLMYRSIAGHPGARSLYAQKLVAAGVVTGEQVEDYANAYRNVLANAQAEAEQSTARSAVEAIQQLAEPTYSPPALEAIRELAHRISAVPDDITLHSLVTKVVSSRREMADGARP